MHNFPLMRSLFTVVYATGFEKVTMQPVGYGCFYGLAADSQQGGNECTQLGPLDV